MKSDNPYHDHLNKEAALAHFDDSKRGLYNKFHIARTDGSSGPGGKHERCEYFVLDLVHDKHARLALFAYAESCRDEFPGLARDLQSRAQRMSSGQ